MIRSLILILGCLASSAPGWAAEVVITHPGSAAKLTEEDAKEFMLGRRTQWADGTSVLVGVVADPVQPALTGLTGITTQQFHMIWKKLLFTEK